MFDVPYDCSFEELGHTAEIGMRVRAATPGRLFACAALAMFALIDAASAPESERVSQRVELHSLDMESLMVDWLSELVFLHETTGAIYDEIDIHQWSPQHLEATLCGRRAQQVPHMQIKAVTYHDLIVAATDDEWLAQVYFDI